MVPGKHKRIDALKVILDLVIVRDKIKAVIENFALLNAKEVVVYQGQQNKVKEAPWEYSPTKGDIPLFLPHLIIMYLILIKNLLFNLKKFMYQSIYITFLKILGL